MAVVLHAECFEFSIVVGHVGITAAAEVATVNVGSAKGVANACLWIEICLHEFLLFFCIQLSKNLCRGIGECAANANHGLKSFGRINKHADLCFHRLPHLFKANCFCLADTQICFVSSGVNCYFFTFGGIFFLYAFVWRKCQKRNEKQRPV